MQAEHVQALLRQRGLSVELLGMTTKGDQILDRTLSKVGGKGLFVKELEVALEEGRAHIAVHSLKDVPMELPAGFALACVMEREDPRDAFVSPHYASLAQLPQGAVVGTSSLRRQVLLHALRPDLKIVPLRGNLDTRLRKLDEGQYARCIVLAAAGLKRLKMDERIRSIFEPEEMLPAAGQGALGIEIRSDREDLRLALQSLVDMPTWLRVTAERAVKPGHGRQLLGAAGRVRHAGGRYAVYSRRLGRPRRPTPPGTRRATRCCHHIGTGRCCGAGHCPGAASGGCPSPPPLNRHGRFATRSSPGQHPITSAGCMPCATWATGPKACR